LRSKSEFIVALAAFGTFIGGAAAFLDWADPSPSKNGAPVNHGPTSADQGLGAPGNPSPLLKQAPGGSTPTSASGTGAGASLLNVFPTGAPVSKTTVLSGLQGTWRGTVTQPDFKLSPYPVVVNIHPGEIGDEIGEVRYPTLSCSGRWVLVAEKQNEFTVDEEIDQGADTCIHVELAITLRPDSELDVVCSSPYPFRKGC
jgi:hypothetical protein